MFPSLKRLRRRLRRELWGPSPILVNSVPKSGTNLLKNIVYALPYTYASSDMSLVHEMPDADERLRVVRAQMPSFNKGVVYSGHIPYSVGVAQWLQAQSVKHIIIYRDPRAVAVSGYHYLKRFKHSDNARGRMYFEMFDQFADDSERLLAYIQGVGAGKTAYCFAPDSYPNIRLIFDAYMGWFAQPDVLTVRYEDFIGSDGVDMTSAITTTQNIIDFVGLTGKANAEDVFRKGQNPDNSPTFRQGRSDSWRDEYTPAHHAAFATVAGDLLHQLGYTDN